MSNRKPPDELLQMILETIDDCNDWSEAGWEIFTILAHEGYFTESAEKHRNKTRFGGMN